MTVFISHSFENKPEFENIADALLGKGVPFWNPSEIRPGASLREQLRSAVENCSLCVFVASRASVSSSWCGAELGAFWGAGKPIIVYIAEASLKEDELPPIVQGDVWERRLSRIAESAHEIVAKQNESERKDSNRPVSVADLTVEQFQNMIGATIALAAAGRKDDAQEPSIASMETAVKSMAGQVVMGFRATSTLSGNREGDDWKRQILWVDDRPENNVYERQAFEAMGLRFTLALSTAQALELCETKRFSAIISDMGRKEGPREGYVLLEEIRKRDTATPFFIYAGSRAEHHKREASLRGAQGTTNVAQELMDMVVHYLRGKE